MADPHLDPEPRTSVEKVGELIAGGNGMQPSDPQGAQMLALFKSAAPMITRFIPQDPDELDATLLGLASMALRLRSDDAAPPPPLEQLLAAPLEGEAEEVPAP